VTVFIASAIVEAIFLIAPLYFALKYRPIGSPRRAALQLLGLRRSSLWRAVWLVLAGYAAVFVFGVLYDQLNIKTNADALARQVAHAPITTIATLLVAVTVAPFAEELFFRGFVLPSFARAMPLWAAVLLSALIFGLAHADLGSLLPLCAIGLVLGIIRWRAGSSWPGIALHAVNNGVATIVILASTLHH
jgi:membrane protease YdiL (CAAX protease family)